MVEDIETIEALDQRLRAEGGGAAEETAARLAAISTHDPRIGAFQAVDAEAAQAAATAVDVARAAGRRLGPLHGSTFALKDIVDLDGAVTTWGSAALATRRAPSTGTLARRLLAAGAVLLGKTKTVECALGGWGTNQRMGTPWNPRDPAVHRAPGGSSSGSGAAVAAGMTGFAVGTDTGGSVRIPAAFCGIFGLKVTEGRLPLDGIMPLSRTLDTPGPMTSTVRDAALVFAIMDGAEGASLDADLAAGSGLFAELGRGVEGLRFGVLDETERARVEPSVLALYDAAVAALADRGARPAPFRSPVSYDALAERTGRIIAAEGWAEHGALYGDPDMPMDEDVRARMSQGAEIGAAEYLELLHDRRLRKVEFLAAMQDFDALLTPTAPMVAPPVAEIDQAVSPGRFTRPVNYLGLCALSVPMGRAAGGLPAGLQIVGRPFAEALVLRVGAEVERGVEQP